MSNRGGLKITEAQRALHRKTFCCWICARSGALLIRARVSLWPRTFAEMMGGEELELKPRLLCAGCMDGFVLEPGTICGSLERAGRAYRLSLSKKPVQYDLDRWIRYRERYVMKSGMHADHVGINPASSSPCS